MANSTSSTRKAKVDDNNIVRRAKEIGSINSDPSVSDATGLRRSPREISSKKIIPSSSSTRKSERLGKRTSQSPLVRRKSERVEKQKMSSPLRRSERTKNHSFLASSDSKSLGSSASKQKKQIKEKSVKQLTFETKEVNENEKHDVGTSQVKNKRMNARAYRAMLKAKAKIDCGEESNRMDKLSQEGVNNNGGEVDECFKGSHLDCKEVSENGMLPSDNAKGEGMKANSRLSGPMKEPLEHNETLVSLQPSNATSSKTSGTPEMVHTEEETLQKLGSEDTLLDENTVRNSVGYEKGENLMCSKRKGIVVDMHYDVSAGIPDDYDCNMIAGAAPSRLCECKAGNINGNCVTCSKRIRVDHDHRVQEGFSCNSKESVNPSAIEDRGEIEINITTGIAEEDIDYTQPKDTENIQTDDGKICLICKCGGQLLFCNGKGCNGCYHLSCLEPPMVDAPLGIWHCHLCVRKKIELGVYSVSEGIESIWDAKEVEVYIDGLITVKQFLVKYKGLAHIHDRWVPESQLLLEAPLLLKKFNEKDQALRWKPEWSLPHRLLQKRALISAKQHDDPRYGPAVDNFDCQYEWLVKWRGLGYEHASWELDNAFFLHSSEGQRLVKDYEDRHQRAKRVSLNKKLDRVNTFGKLSQIPGGVPSGFGNNNLDAVNKLREHWHKGQNAIVIDDYDRIVNVVAFILSVHSDTYRPFLIISTSAALHLWEDQFSHLAPSVNVVIYSGNKGIRKSIRKLEFNEEDSCLLFQVLVAVPEIIIEDLDVLRGIEWEAIIVDECQCSKISSCWKQIKMLNSDLRLVLFNGQLKDSIVEYLNILALLDSQSDNEFNDELMINSSDRIGQLKDRLSSYVGYRCKSDSFRFVEYWVPVKISNVQLEQYCATLLSNTSVLRSSSKKDIVWAQHDILITARKCCNHPYLVDPSLQTLLTKELQPVEYLGVGIKASGKLQLLDLMLMELKKQGLRGLILFQSTGGSGKASIGDILDDFLRQRFGADSYERVDKCVLHSKKQAALKMFNNKDHGRFVFLLETCACLTSIKLSSVDTIIIFDSDWNPMNDIRALQKITLDSQFERIKIFRLYSSATVEERALILAKQDKPLDSRLQNISRGISHLLLMWGASCLFDELNAFHAGKNSDSAAQLLLQEAMHEFSSVLKQDGDDNDTRSCSILLKVRQNGGTYRANFSLLGEGKFGSLDEVPSHLFWEKVLEGRHPQWKYSSGSSQRSRKRVQPFDASVYRPDFVSEDIAKKRKKVTNNVDKPSSKSEGNSGDVAGNVSRFLPSSTACVGGALDVNLTSYSICLADEMSERPQGNDAEYEKIRRLRDKQRSLHLSLKPEIAKLCEVLLLPDEVKKTADNFLEYVMNNHHVNREPVSILQAFQISLCWTAASLLKHKIDYKASLMLAKQHLNFDCKKEEADYIYSMLRCLKKIFLYRTGNSNVTASPKASDSENLNRDCSCTGLAPEVDLAMKDVSKSIKEIQKKCQKQLRKLLLKHQEEKNKLNAAHEEEKADLEKKYKIESAVIRSCTPNDVMRTEKLKTLDNKYTERVEDLKCQYGKGLKDLEIVQSVARQKFQDREATWVADLKSWVRDELLSILPSKEHSHGVEYLKTSEQAEPDNGPKNVALVSDHVAEGKSFDRMVETMTRTVVGLSKTPETISPVACKPVEVQTSLVKHAGSNDLDASANDLNIRADEDCDKVQNACDSQGNIISMHSHSKEQNSDGATRMTKVGEGHENFRCDGCREKTVTLVLPSPNEEICDTVMSDVSRGEVALEMLKISSSTDSPDEVPSSRQGKLDGNTSCMPACGLSFGEVKALGSSDRVKNIAFLNSQSSEEHNQSGIAVCLPTSDCAAQIHEVEDNNDSNNAVTLNSPLFVERIAAGAAVCASDREIPAEMPGTVDFTDGSENVITTNPPLSMELISDGGAVNVLDRELSSRLCRNPPLLDKTFNGVSLSIHDRQIPVELPETSHEVPESHNDREHQTDAILLDRSTTSDEQDGMSRTTNNNTLSQETPLLLSSPSMQPLLTSPPAVSVNEAPQHPCASSFTSPRMADEVQQLSSADSPSSNQNTAGEMLNSSQQVEPVSSPVDVASANRSNHESLVMEPLVQAQQLPSAESHSNQDPSNLPLPTGFELQPVNASLSSLVPQALREVTNQAVVQLASGSELDSHTPVGAIRIHSSDTRNVSTPSEINNRLIQTATQAGHRMPPSLYFDPLKNELESICKESEKIIKNHEDMKLQLKFDCEREIEEIHRKYDIKLQETEVEFQQKKKNLDSSLNIVLMNKILAEAFRSKCLDLKVSGASRMQRDASFAQELVQISRPACSQTMVPPLQAASDTSGFFSGVSARPSHVNSISPPSGNPQAVSGFPTCRPPHIPPYRPSTSMPTTSLPTLPDGMSSQQALGNIPEIPSFPHHPRPTPPTYLSNPRLPAPNSSAMELLMNASSQCDINLPSDLSCMSNVVSLNLSEFGTNSSIQDNTVHQATSTDVVCLSDDD